MTMLGASTDFPSARRRARHRHLSAIPASIAASLEPVVEQPVASSWSGEFQSRLMMFTQRISMSAVRGYSSLSIMFLSNVIVMSSRACGSIHVDTNVARFSRAFPSSMSSSVMSWAAVSGRIGSCGRSVCGRSPAAPARAKIGDSRLAMTARRSRLDVLACSPTVILSSRLSHLVASMGDTPWDLVLRRG